MPRKIFAILALLMVLSAVGCGNFAKYPYPIGNGEVKKEENLYYRQGRAEQSLAIEERKLNAKYLAEWSEGLRQAERDWRERGPLGPFSCSFKLSDLGCEAYTSFIASKVQETLNRTQENQRRRGQIDATTEEIGRQRR